MSHIFQKNSQRTRAGRISNLVLRLVSGESYGGALLELALVLPIFSLLIVGAAEFGRVEYFSIEAANAARTGVAYAAQGTAFENNTSAIQTAADNDAPNLANVATLTVTSNTVCQCDNAGVFTPAGTTESCTAAASSCTGSVISYVQVNTSAPVSTILRWPGFPSSITVQGQAIMRIK
jgi:Flp pilus assembly protein TadG